MGHDHGNQVLSTEPTLQWGEAQMEIQPLVIFGTLEALAAITTYVLEAAKVAAIDRRGTYRLRLAVDEIATNIILHGYSAAGDTGTIGIRACIYEQALTITLEDTARPYDPRTHPGPIQLDRVPQDRELGGLGIYLARNSVDNFMYMYTGERNLNTFVIYRRTNSAGPTSIE